MIITACSSYTYSLILVFDLVCDGISCVRFDADDSSSIFRVILYYHDTLMNYLLLKFADTWQYGSHPTATSCEYWFL